MSNDKRVVLYNDDPDAGGVAIYTHEVALGLAKIGWRVTCVQTESTSPMIAAQRGGGVHHHWLGYNTRQDSWRAMTNESDAEQAFKTAKPDVVLFANCAPFSSLAAKTVAVRLGIPFVIVEHFVGPLLYFPPQLAEFCLPAVECHYQNAKAVVAVSEENLDLLHMYYRLPADKGEVIHCGRPDRFFEPRNESARERLRREYRLPSSAVLCITVARLEGVKGHQLLLAAMRRLSAMPIWSHLYFAWVGTGSLELDLKQSLAESGLTGHVIMPGHCWDVSDWLDASDVFLLPSLLEGLPLTVMEAMAKGLPVLATAVSGTPEALGETGKLLPPPNLHPEATVASMVSILEQWASDSNLRLALGAACKQRALSMFREERMVRQTNLVLERALQSRND